MRWDMLAGRPIGYVQCVRCGTLRPASEVESTPRGPRCRDVALCGRLAGVGTGTLDADEGGPDAVPGQVG